MRFDLIKKYSRLLGSDSHLYLSRIALLLLHTVAFQVHSFSNLWDERLERPIGFCGRLMFEVNITLENFGIFVRSLQGWRLLLDQLNVLLSAYACITLNLYDPIQLNVLNCHHFYLDGTPWFYSGLTFGSFGSEA